MQKMEGKGKGYHCGGLSGSGKGFKGSRADGRIYTGYRDRS